MERRAVGDGQPGGMIEIQAIRQLDEPLGLGDHALARRPRTDMSEHAVAAAECGCVRPDALDHAGEFCRR